MSRGSPWATCLRHRPVPALRLFCFPYAGSGAAIFRRWANELPESIEVWPVHLPGRERRIADEPIPSIAGLVAAATEGLRDLLEGRFALFGHSMGALLSFELTRQLRREGLAGPCCLAVSGLGAPHIPSLRAPTAHLSDVEFLEELQRLRGTPPDVLDDPELIELLLPVLRADFFAVETYSFEPDTPLSCPIFAYGGANDTSVPREHLERWDLHTSGAFTPRLFRGNHFYLNSRRAELIAILAGDLMGTCT